MTISVTQHLFDPAVELGNFNKALLPSVGAVVSFVGHVRGQKNSDDCLILEHHPVMTHKVIDGFRQQAMSRWTLADAMIIHRYGVMMVGEPIVFVATAATHRRAAFEAADFLMDVLKTQTPLWKKEKNGGQERWIEPTQQDYADVQKWKL